MEFAFMVELVDTLDLKSNDHEIVSVRVRLEALCRYSSIGGATDL